MGKIYACPVPEKRLSKPRVYVLQRINGRGSDRVIRLGISGLAAIEAQYLERW